jgi:undecaprenyl-diphosphatase
VRVYFQSVSRLGDGALWYALMLVPALLGGAKGLEAALHLALVGATSALLYRRLKHWTKRPRPCADDRRIRAWIAPLDEYSFPSGHTLHAVGFSLVACTFYPWLAWLLVPFTLSVAASRVVLGVHYPSDVAAATLIGAAVGSATLALG